MRKFVFLSDYEDPTLARPTGPGPNRRAGLDAMREYGFDGEYVLFFKPPWNPLGHAHAVWRAIDPARAVWTLTRRRDAAAIMSFAESGAVMPLLLRRLFGSRTPIVVMHDSDHANWRPRRMVQDFVLPRVELVLIQTHAQGRYLTQQYRLRRPPFYVGPQMDDDFFRPMPGARQDYVLAVGNDKARDFQALIDAVAPLDLHLRLLTRLPVTLPSACRARIEVIAQRIDYAALRDLYNNARLVVLPLRERISPGGQTSVLEAMAMGKPTVMTASSGVVELVVPGVTGLMPPVDDVPALSQAIATLWDDPARCLVMGQAGRARLEAEYSTKLRAERTAAALRLLENAA
jgi:glycosyltransferase involved in cell wall biosynthesis